MSAGAAAPVRARRFLFWMLLSLPVAAILAWFGLLALAVSLADENFEVRRGSVQYYALMGSTIRNVPLVEPAGEPRFEFRGGDGPKPTETIISYASRADAARLEAEIGRYLVARGYERRRYTETATPLDHYVSGGVSFDIYLQPLPDKTVRVFVTKYEW